ncbi:MAG: hypothetical protein H0W97_01545 [Actinobacteria bacterium]|nr:hypothetical protein [Actinomycetota bacterium]
MTPELQDALARWETGELSRDELARRFPDEDISGLLEAFDRMRAAAEPTPDAETAWETIRGQLPDRLADRRRGRGKAIRLLAAAMIAVLLMGATAYAFVPGVRRAMNDAAGVITGDADRSPNPTWPGKSPKSEADRLAHDVSRGDASEPQGEDDEAVEPDSDSDPGEHDTDTDSHSGSDDDGAEGDSVSGGGSSGDDSGSDAEATDGSESGDEGSGATTAESESSDSGSEGSES